MLTDIASFQNILSDKKVLDEVISTELKDLATRFGDKRRTEIVEDVEEVTMEDFIPEEDIVITLSKDGLIKRQPIELYRLQAKGGKGRKGAVIHEDDSIAMLCVTNTHRDIYFFTNFGRIMSLRGYEIPETKTEKGKPSSKYLPLAEGEKIVNIAGADTKTWKFAFFITKSGIAKRITFENLKYTNRAKRIMKLDDGDEIAQVRLTKGKNDLLIVTQNGQALRVAETEFRPLGRTARGVIAITLKNGDKVLSCDVVDDRRKILVISEMGIGKRLEFSSFMPHHRSTNGICIMELSEKTGKLSGSLALKDTDEILAITSKGRIIRMPVDGITVMKRHSVGNIIIRLDEGDKVADFSVISSEDDDNDVTVPIPFDDEIEEEELTNENENENS